MNDEDLEQMVRTGLRSKAGEVEVGTGYADQARTGASARRHTRVGIVAAATAAVIVASVAVADRVGQNPDPTPIAGPTTTDASPDRTGETSAVPGDWRVESYGGVQLRVPPDWGWGGVPMKDPAPGPRLMTCGEGAFAFPGDGGQTRFVDDVDMPYVGRADYYMTDVCTSGGVEQGDPTAPPVAKHPWVWLGSPLAVGTVELPNDFVQETVEVNGVRVTVGDDDPAELATILGSIEGVDVDDNGCDAKLRTASQLRPQEVSSDPFRDLGRVESVSVCAYRFIDDETVRLGYSSRVEGQRAQQVVDEIAATPAVIVGCVKERLPSLDTVIMRFVTADMAFDVLTTFDGCPLGYDTGVGVRAFSSANVEPWVVDGVGLYVSGGQVGNALSGIFRPIPG
jgi:hypothetical protein